MRKRLRFSGVVVLLCLVVLLSSCGGWFEWLRPLELIQYPQQRWRDMPSPEIEYEMYYFMRDELEQLEQSPNFQFILYPGFVVG